MKLKEIIKLCESEDSYFHSMREYKNPKIPGEINIPGWKLSQDKNAWHSTSNSQAISSRLIEKIDRLSYCLRK